MKLRILHIGLLLVASLGFSSGAHAQFVSFTQSAQHHGSGGSTFLVNYGQTIADTNNLDNGNGLVIFYTPFTTNAASTQNVTSLGEFVESPQSGGNWGLAIYNDSSGPSTLVSGCTTFSTSTPGSPVATLTPSGCSLSANAKYWVAEVTTINATQSEVLSSGACSNGGGFSQFQSIGSFTSSSSWPGTASGLTVLSNCYAAWATVQYTSAAAYNVVSAGVSSCTLADNPCSLVIATTGSGHSLHVGAGAIGTTFTSVTDSASDTFTNRGSCGGAGLCISSTDRATSNVNTLTATFAASGFSYAIAYEEVAGTLSSSSFDQSAYGPASSATPFTSNATSATGQAVEFLCGLAWNSLATGTFSASGGWTVPYQLTVSGGGTTISLGLFNKTTGSTGTQTLTGSYSSIGSDNDPGLATFK
jgi:hypothetical protein